MNTDKIYAQIIAQEYAPKSNYKTRALQRLDCRSKLPAKVIAHCLGIFLVIFSFIASITTLSSIRLILPWICLICLNLNHLLYPKLEKQFKQRYAFEIIEIAKEISES